MCMLIALAPSLMVNYNLSGGMEQIKFRVQADPVAQGRPRLTTIGGMARAFDPKKSKDWKAFIKDVALKAMHDCGHVDPLQGPLCARMRFGFALPKSQYRKRTPRIRTWHTNRPDIDNLVKGILDACESVVFMTDTQITKLVVDKIICAQGEAPFVAVSYEALPEFSGV